jgi:hypothetical protein
MIYGSTKPPKGALLNFSHPLSKGIVGCWLFNEGMGDKVYDSSGNGNTGTLTNMSHPSTVTSGWNPGKFGKAIAFDGSNDYVFRDHREIFYFGTKDFSISIIFKTAATSGAMVFYRDLAVDQSGYGLYLSSGYLRFLTMQSITTYYSTSSNLVNDNNFHHGVGIRRGIKTEVYVDGILKGTNTWASSLDVIDNNSPICIGYQAGSSSSNYFNGSLDFPIIYNRALLPSEVLQLYQEPFCMFND